MADAQPVRAMMRYLNAQLSEDYPVLFLNAELPENSDDFSELKFPKEELYCVQPQRGKFLGLQLAGIHTTPDIEESGRRFGQVWVKLGKFRSLNEFNIVSALRRAKQGGRIIICGAKHSGVSSLKKWLSGYFEVSESYAKFHSQLFEFSANTGDVNKLTCSTHDDVVDRNIFYRTSPGLFSADRVDAGSSLLCDHLNQNITGKVADLGSGWGYLDRQLLDQFPDIKLLHLFETEWQGLEASRFNLASANHNCALKFSWCDIVREPIEIEYNQSFDWVIMNPPFHEGRAKDVSLGGHFIAKAAKILKSSGRLLMVANRKLPYEAGLNKFFKQVKVLEEANGFKVFLARK